MKKISSKNILKISILFLLFSFILMMLIFAFKPINKLIPKEQDVSFIYNAKISFMSYVGKRSGYEVTYDFTKIDSEIEVEYQIYDQTFYNQPQEHLWISDGLKTQSGSYSIKVFDDEYEIPEYKNIFMLRNKQNPIDNIFEFKVTGKSASWGYPRKIKVDQELGLVFIDFKLTVGINSSYNEQGKYYYTDDNSDIKIEEDIITTFSTTIEDSFFISAPLVKGKYWLFVGALNGDYIGISFDIV